MNGSGEPEIHRDLTDAVRQAFISDGRLKIAPGAGADIVLKGNLNYYRLQAVAFSPTDVVSQYWVEVGLQVEAMDQVKKRVLLKQNFLTKWDYRITADVVDAERARQDALDQAYSDLANRLVSVLIEQF
ncbi:MAG: hypothetical protein COV67_02035 [Nitrospinae bacterium CG11_big_fil_rev_8_21_14_0_20_56_8]|nr:MAG: hypothetical protein COV67_02035 [Nitrospinae bacterium CG11_big_fil_rev_8_21_14_0_20_56_8]